MARVDAHTDEDFERDLYDLFASNMSRTGVQYGQHDRILADHRALREDIAEGNECLRLANDTNGALMGDIIALRARLDAAEAVCEEGVCPSCGKVDRLANFKCADYRVCAHHWHAHRAAWQAVKDGAE